MNSFSKKAIKHYILFRLGDAGIKMMAYEFYWNDKDGGSHFIGSLPERRKNPERITWESIMNWGRMIVGDSGHGGKTQNISFVTIEV